VSQKTETKEIKRLQQELKKAQHDLKVTEFQEKKANEIRHLDWEKEKFKLQLEHDKERWVFESKAKEQTSSLSSLEMLKTIHEYTLIITDLKERVGALTAQVTIYKPFFDKHMAEHKSETA
jgi:DNA replication protein DnaC